MKKDESCFPAAPTRIYGSGSGCYEPDKATRRILEYPSAQKCPLPADDSGYIPWYADDQGVREPATNNLLPQRSPSGAVHAPASLPSAGKPADDHDISCRPIYGLLSLHGHNKTKPMPAVSGNDPKKSFPFHCPVYFLSAYEEAVTDNHNKVPVQKPATSVRNPCRDGETENPGCQSKYSSGST